uniref:Transmembrane protein n=1 Tax=Solanum lycopersicum TaxID=4081 RepID=A0A3Q7ENE2_SOLLC
MVFHLKSSCNPRVSRPGIVCTMLFLALDFAIPLAAFSSSFEEVSIDVKGRREGIGLFGPSSVLIYILSSSWVRLSHYIVLKDCKTRHFKQDPLSGTSWTINLILKIRLWIIVRLLWGSCCLFRPNGPLLHKKLALGVAPKAYY